LRRGGSHIGIARPNPTKNPEHLESTVVSLLRLGVTYWRALAAQAQRTPERRGEDEDG